MARQHDDAVKAKEEILEPGHFSTGLASGKSGISNTATRSVPIDGIIKLSQKIYNTNL